MSTAIIINNEYDNSIKRVKELGFTSYSERKFEPQTQNNFSIEFMFDQKQVAYIMTYMSKYLNYGNEFIGLDEGDNPANYWNKHYEGLKIINEALNQSITNLNSPTKSLGQVTVDFFNSQIKYAGKPTFSDASFTFNSFIGLGTKSVLAAWSDIAMSERTMAGGWARSESTQQPGGTTIGLTSDMVKNSPDEALNRLHPYTGYKVDGTLLECARDGSIVNQWKYIGMWVKSFTPGSYNMAGSNSTSQVSATICVDKVEQVNLDYFTSMEASIDDRNDDDVEGER